MFRVRSSLAQGFEQTLFRPHPIGVKKLQWGAGFYETSGGEISACLEKARQTGKDQQCTITVPVPTQE